MLAPADPEAFGDGDSSDGSSLVGTCSGAALELAELLPLVLLWLVGNDALIPTPFGTAAAMLTNGVSTGLLGVVEVDVVLVATPKFAPELELMEVVPVAAVV